MSNHSDLTSRQKTILSIIIGEFVRTGEPVSSASITENHGIHYSAATVRNEMAKLEELGFLKQPHTASGRIPLDSAYRLLVDEILSREITAPPKDMAETIDREYEQIRLQMEILLERTVDLLARLTNYTSLLLAPKIKKYLLRHMKLVYLEPFRVLLILITSSGSLIHRLIDLSTAFTEEQIYAITNRINHILSEESPGTLSERIRKSAENTAEKQLLQKITDYVEEAGAAENEEILLSGKTRIFDFSESRDVGRIKVMMEILEEGKTLAELMTAAINDSTLKVIIGSENPLNEMQDCSVITATYRINRQPAGTLGIIGPRRMYYEHVIPIVTYTAENFSNMLDKIEKL